MAGSAWVFGMALVVISQVLKLKTSAPSAFTSATQVTGVAAILLSLAGILWGVSALAARLGGSGERFAAAILWALLAGLVLLPFLGVGAVILFPALVTMVAVGRLGPARVRFPALVLLAGLLTAAMASGWKSGAEGPVFMNLLVFLATALEGLGWIWFGRATDDVPPPTITGTR